MQPATQEMYSKITGSIPARTDVDLSASGFTDGQRNSAAGLVKNDFYPAHPTKTVIFSNKEKGLASDRLPEGGDDGMLHRRSLFDVLDENKVSWRYYYTLYWPPKIGDSTRLPSSTP